MKKLTVLLLFTIFTSLTYAQNNTLFQLDTRYLNNTTYVPAINGNGNWSNSDGALIYNEMSGTLDNRFAAITLATRDANSQFLTIAKINSIATGTGQADMTFQLETNTNGNNDRILERMRITSDGTVEIALQQVADNNLALHTAGDLQFDNLPTGSGNVLVLDANNNVMVSTATSTFTSNHTTKALKGEISNLEARVAELEDMVKALIKERDLPVEEDN